MNSKRKNIRYFLYFIMCILLISLVIKGLFGIQKNAVLTVAFLDVGQGDAIFIETPNNIQVLIDGGKDASVIDRLHEHMSSFDTTIDLVIATHPDTDHIGGLVYVLDQYTVGRVIDNGKQEKNTTTYNKLEQEIKEEIIQSDAVYEHARQGSRIILDERANVYLDIYFPTEAVQNTDVNELSVVAELVYGDTEFLLTGDAGVIVEEQLLNWCRQCLDADVLKAGHHGSRTSTSQKFLDAVSPEYAIISASQDNSYNHPHAEVMQRLQKAGIKIKQTSLDGTIVFETDGKEMWIRSIQPSSR